MNLIKYYDNTRRLIFGKYQGEPVWDIIKSDPQYISWCLHNLNNFILTENETKYLRRVDLKRQNEIRYSLNNMPMWYKRKYGYCRNYRREESKYSIGGYGCGDRNLYG